MNDHTTQQENQIIASCKNLGGDAELCTNIVRRLDLLLSLYKDNEEELREEIRALQARIKLDEVIRK